jgi:hypothetical protein
MTSPAIARLREKRAELAGEINQLQRRMIQLRADLAHVDGALRVLEPGIELEKIVPRRIEFRPRYFKRGELTRLCLDFMREHAAESVAVADIMPTAIGDRRLNSAEYRAVAVVTYEALRKLAKRGTLRQDGQGAKAARFLVR